VAAFIANVGVNSSHAARSPIFEDGSFCLLPIPERARWRPPMLRMGDLPALAPHAPTAWRARPVHLDPDLASAVATYGDNCRRAGRAFSLRGARPGDLVVFLARLQPAGEPAGFHLIGRLVIDDVMRDVTAEPGDGWWDSNAHVRRARATGDWDSFWVFRGGSGSGLFARARAFGRREAAAVFGDGWTWGPGRTELQAIGSSTRAVRRVEGAGEEWLRSICPS
jgi:hypothetical protein